MAKKKPDKNPDILTSRDLKIASLRIIDGMRFADIYTEMHPKNHMSRDNRRKEAFKEWKKAEVKIGSWAEIFDSYDVGPYRLIKMLDDALEANSTIVIGGKVAQIPDHKTRIAAGKELKEIHGLNEQTINVINEGPIPITYFYEQPREIEKPEPDDETTD